MPTVIMAERERGIQRTRPRPNARGNFISLAVFATVYTLTFTPTDAHYIQWRPYRHPEPKAIGYFDDPPIDPPMVPLGPVAQIEAVPQIIGILESQQPLIPTIETFPITTIPTSPAETLIIPPVSIPAGSTLIADTAHKPGDAFSTIVGLVRSQLFATPFPIRGVTILSDDGNAGTIWIGYKNSVVVNNGFKLVPGSAKDFNIDDLSAIWIVASAANQIIHVEYTI